MIAEQPLKPALMAALATHTDQRGWVSIATPDLALLTGASQHDVVHDLWDFQKQGFLKFRERHLTQGSELSRIRLTAAGRKAADEMAKPVVIDSPLANAPRDPGQAKPDLIAWVPPRPATDRQRSYPTASIVATGVAEAAMPETFLGVRQKPLPNPDKFPLVKALVERRAKVELAAALLEEAGEDELALAAMERAKTEYTPFEDEVVRMYRGLVDAGL